MNNSDKNNPRRLIRAIEITKYLLTHNISINRSVDKQLDILLIGLTASKEVLCNRIDKRVDQRIKDGALDEVKELLKRGYSWDLHAFSSTGIRQLKEYFEGKEKLEEAVNKWKLAEKQYAKRQLTWFKKMKDIHWFDIETSNYQKQIEDLVQKWYTSPKYHAVQN